MSFPRYPKYKDSGVEWLGKVPEHWVVQRADSVLTATRDGIEAPELNGQQVFHYSIPAVQQFGDGQLESGDEIHSSKIVITERQVLISKLNPRKGTVCIASPKEMLTVCSSEFVPLISIDSDLIFVYYLVQTENYRQRLESLVESATRSHQRVTPSEILNAQWAFPAPPEQTAIAAFLDRETAKIDGLVAEQRRLMELLKEKRQAVISHAATKGLNPNVPMKPSGIEWLGDVPEHWEMSPLKWVTDPDRPIMYGIVLPGPDVGEGVPILKGGNVKPSRMNLESMARTTPEIEARFARARLKKGDLVYAIRGTIGDCEQVSQELEGSNITQDVARVAIAERHSSIWARWVLLASAIQEELACGSLGAAVRGINIFDLKRVKIPTPPSAEQKEIAAFLDRETAKLEELTAETQRAIELLLERRTALISAAVTGQIDVRQISFATES